MITGHVTSTREAIIRVAVRGAGAREETGAARAALGDGSEAVLDAFEAVVVWDNGERSVVTLATGGAPLVGMALLSGYRVALDVVEGGRAERRQRDYLTDPSLSS